jgi:hypothetical protein
MIKNTEAKNVTKKYFIFPTFLTHIPDQKKTMKDDASEKAYKK